MGKSRRNRGGARRDPLSKPVKPPSDPELAALREAKIVPIIRDLQSADPKSRSAAAAAASSIVVQDERCRKLLLREHVVAIVLGQTLTDAALESRAAGWGILQVLAQEEEADFCVHLYRQDVLTAIEHASTTVTKKLFEEAVQASKSSKAEQAVLVSIAGSLISLCTALAEAQDDILEAVAASNAVSSLLFHVVTANSRLAQGLDNLRSDALACLMILSEENQKFAQHILASKNSQVLQALETLKSEVSGDGVLACAILQNLYYTIQDEQASEDVGISNPSALIPTLSKVIAGITAESTDSKEDSWSNPIQYQQLALETLASIGTSLNSADEQEEDGERDQPSGPKKNKGANGAVEDEDDDMAEADADSDADDVGEAAGDDEGDDDEDDDEMDEDAMQADMDMVTGADDDDDAANQGIDDVPVLKAVLHQALPEVIRVASMPTRDDVSTKFQSLALSALNNIAWSVSMVDFTHEHNAGIHRAWKPAGRSIWEGVISPILASDTADITLAAQVTGLAWAVARTLRAETPLQRGEHRKFISLYQATRGTDAGKGDGSGAGGEDDPFQGLGVKCIGVLGQLAMDPAPVDLNREIGTFLVTLLASILQPPEAPVADVIEALNQVLDIYADEDFAYDRQVFWKDNFLQKLDGVRESARTLFKTVDKRTHGELRMRADETVLNLDRFVAYKGKHKP